MNSIVYVNNTMIFEFWWGQANMALTDEMTTFYWTNDVPLTNDVVFTDDVY